MQQVTIRLTVKNSPVLSFTNNAFFEGRRIYDLTPLEQAIEDFNALALYYRRLTRLSKDLIAYNKIITRCKESAMVDMQTIITNIRKYISFAFSLTDQNAIQQKDHSKRKVSVSYSTFTITVEM